MALERRKVLARAEDLETEEELQAFADAVLEGWDESLETEEMNADEEESASS